MSLVNRPIHELTGALDCPCGRTHRLSTKLAAVVQDAPARLAQLLAPQKPQGRFLLLCDANTYDVLGKRAAEALSAVAPVDVCALRGDNLHADEEAVGAALIATQEDTCRIIAVGSGTINDTARYVATRVRVPYDVLGTAPSMDGFVSSVSPLIRRGFKVTFEAIAPDYALLDLPAMQSAPANMIAAGLGDVMGKYSSLADWELSHEVYEEYHCPETAALMRKAVDTCSTQADKLRSRDASAITALGEGLLLSGLAMQMVGNSRPASGLEHHMAHFWEIMQLSRGERPTLHGDKVGYAELLALEYYRCFFARKRPFADVNETAWLAKVRAAFGSVADEVLASTPPQALPAAVVRERAAAKWETLKAIARTILPMQGSIRSMLRACGGPVTAKELGLSRDDVHDALRYAMMIRPRPTIMRIAQAWGIHEQICDEVMERIDV